MGIINWMQNRLGGKQEKKKPDAPVKNSRSVPIRESCRQDLNGDDSLNGCPQGLLSIGTLGNDDTPARQEPPEGPPRASKDVPDFTMEEVKKLQEALNKLLRRAKSKSSSRGSEAADDERTNLPLDRFLNCPSSLEVDRTVPQIMQGDGGGGENGEFSPDTQIVLSKARELLMNSNNSTIKQKSFKFLLKKMFVCRGCFVPAPSLKDPVESRMEKFFRTMLQKKMNVRPSNAAASRKFFLEDKPMGKTQRDRRHGGEEGKGEDIIRWDRTDSECALCDS